MSISECVLCIVAVAGLFGIPGFMLFCVIRRIVRARREKRALQQKVHDAIDNILADGKVEGPKGRYKPMHWAKKWVNHIWSIPASCRRYGMSAKEMPSYPKKEDRE